MRRTLSVCLSVRPSVRPVIVYFTVEPSYERTSKIEKLRFSLMGQRHVCTFRHALRAAYRTAISAAQILVSLVTGVISTGNAVSSVKASRSHGNGINIVKLSKSGACC